MPLGRPLSRSLQLAEEKEIFWKERSCHWSFTQSFSSQLYLRGFALRKRTSYPRGGTYDVEGHLKYGSICHGERSPPKQQIELLTLKSHRACHVHRGQFGGVPLKPLEWQRQQSDLTDQDRACKLFFNLRKTGIQYIIYYPLYKLLKKYLSIKVWQIFQWN